MAVAMDFPPELEPTLEAEVERIASEQQQDYKMAWCRVEEITSALPNLLLKINTLKRSSETVKRRTAALDKLNEAWEGLREEVYD